MLVPPDHDERRTMLQRHTEWKLWRSQALDFNDRLSAGIYSAVGVGF